jgi:four helix bundle protein
MTRVFVKDCYLLTKNFPAEEKFAMVQQIRRAALSVYLNLAEGSPENQKQKESAFLKFHGALLLKLMLL